MNTFFYCALSVRSKDKLFFRNLAVFRYRSQENIPGNKISLIEKKKIKEVALNVRIHMFVSSYRLVFWEL